MTQVLPNTPPPGKELATLAGGCFWCLEAVFDQLKGVFIGTLAIRHSDHHASLLSQGWDEVPVEEIRPN